ncbi:PmoA family protein [Bremerella sp. JC817]|uniref:DUF6807 domain-containing protein n=1 Tax=Bremerella sp. JC817 TaxID=3231756 RepID=UPI003458E9BB
MHRLFSLLLLLSFASVSVAQTYEITQEGDGLTVHYDGKLVTRYLKKSGSKPILYPLLGPDGVPMTRRYPIESVGENEKNDHPHHRSVWFTHGKVNGTDFWLEKEGEGGVIVHEKFEKISDGETAQIVSLNRWETPEGKVLCKDRRSITFGQDEGRQYFDYDVTVTPVDEPVTFGDTKEGTFGIRVAGTMKTDAKMGGTIVNDKGVKNKDAWAKQSAWVDYYGPVQGKTVGVTIMNHPSSYGYPTYWHVRTYGLFAANPFGVHDFVGKNVQSGDHTIKPGEEMNLRYRVLLHEGTTEEADVAGAFSRYEKVQK